MKKRISKGFALSLILAMVLTLTVPAFATETGAENAPPTTIAGCQSNWGTDFKLIFDQNAKDWLSAISSITVNGSDYAQGSSSYSVNGNQAFYACPGNFDAYYLLIGEGAVDTTATCVIKAEGYEDLTLALNKADHTAAIVENQTPEQDQDKLPEEPGNSPGDDQDSISYVQTPTFSTISNMGSSYYKLTFADANYVSGITEVKVNGEDYTATSTYFLLSGAKYLKDTEENSIYFATVSWSSSEKVLKNGDVITLVNPAYQNLTLKVTIAGDTVSIGPGNTTDPEDDYALYVRLVGYFEAALVNQKDYDAISGASTNVTQNQNSNAVVEAALVKKGTTPSETDWKALKDSGITVNKAETSVNLSSESGMAGVYSVYDSSVTLAGTPRQAGTYEITVTVTDDQGRTATSNGLNFKIYTGEETLESVMKVENFRNGEDYHGKYIWDMEPWTIKTFTDENKAEIVTVPVDLKAWYGSNTSGTYGYLGYAIAEKAEKTQTLIVPAGCNLTFVNMDILSSVRIIVEKGATLRLMDSVLDGIAEINGGTFYMDNSASVNGQVILNDGATLKSSVIYSNTNFVANGNSARNNDDPIVVVNGNVTLDGQVYIKGDEAGTYSEGQKGLQVNGTLNLTENSVLAVYGGGHYATTTTGGDAIVMNGGQITGEGLLIAVAGAGTSKGGTAISGTGTVSAAGAYLEGGNTSYKDGTAGKATSSGITLAAETKRNLIDGTVGGGFDRDTYWGSITTTPDLSKYQVYAPETGETPDTEIQPGDGAGVPGTDVGQDTGSTPDTSGTPGSTVTPDQSTEDSSGNVDGTAPGTGDQILPLPDDEKLILDTDGEKTSSKSGNTTKADAASDGEIPQTGDTQPLLPWVMVAALSGLMIVYTKFNKIPLDGKAKR